MSDWNVQWPLPAAIVTRRPAAQEIVRIWHGGPLNIGGSLSGHVAASAAVAGHVKLRQKLSGGIAAAGAMVGAIASRLSLAGHMDGEGSPAGQPSLRVALSGALSDVAALAGTISGRLAMAGHMAAQANLAGNIAGRLAVSGSVTPAAPMVGFASAHLRLNGALAGIASTSGTAAAALPVSGGIASQAALSATVSARRALTGSVAATALLSGSISESEAADPLRGGWNTEALDAGILTFTNDDRTVTSPGATWPGVISKASFSSGNIYLSVRFDAYEYGGIGINDFDKSHEIYFGWDGQIYTSSGGTIDTITGFAAPCDIDVAIRTDDHLVWFRVNGGNWNDDGTADPETSTGGYPLPGTGLTYYVQVGLPYFAGSQRTLNTGTAAFAYPPPAGFTPLQE
ncbi:hypothetical protein [Asticcacaulis sp.]|uniref:hypothetical protein n=1 Tax=Asticcacaulis sp. TaxID=1872648 RepID=UPI003F7BA19F